MKVGDLVKVIWDNDGTACLVTKIERPPFSPGEVWVYLHTGEAFRPNKLELVSESR